MVVNVQKFFQYIYWKNLHVGGPMQFQPMLFKGQLYAWNLKKTSFSGLRFCYHLHKQRSLFVLGKNIQR